MARKKCVLVIRFLLLLLLLSVDISGSYPGRGSSIKERSDNTTLRWWWWWWWLLLLLLLSPLLQVLFYDETENFTLNIMENFLAVYDKFFHPARQVTDIDWFFLKAVCLCLLSTTLFRVASSTWRGLSGWRKPELWNTSTAFLMMIWACELNSAGNIVLIKNSSTKLLTMTGKMRLICLRDI